MKHILLLLCFPLALSATAQELDSGEAFSRLSSVRDDLDLAGSLLDSPGLGCIELWSADKIIDKAIQELLAVSQGLPKLQDQFSLIEPNKEMMKLAVIGLSMAVRHFEEQVNNDWRKRNHRLLASIRVKVEQAKYSFEQDQTYFKSVPAMLTQLAPNMQLLVDRMNHAGQFSINDRDGIGLAKGIIAVRYNHVALVRSQMEQILIDNGFTDARYVAMP